MATPSKQHIDVKLEIRAPNASGPTVTITGAVEDLHNDPQKIYQLLDLLKMPKGTEVKILTTAASSIVR